jgi:hypothetical protein
MSELIVISYRLIVAEFALASAAPRALFTLGG